MAIDTLRVSRHDELEVNRYTIRTVGRWVLVTADSPARALGLVDKIEEALTGPPPKEPRQVGFTDNKEH